MHDERRRAGATPAVGTPTAAVRGRGWGDRRWRLVALLELFALCGFAVAQPLLDTFGRSPEQFAFRGASSSTIVAFGVALTVVPALALWAVELVVGVVRDRLRAWLHVAMVGALVALVSILVLKDATSLRGAPVAAAALAVGVGFAALHARSATLRLWVRVASVTPLAFLVSFLALSPASDLLRAGEVRAAGGVDVGRPAPVVMVVFDELPLTSLLTEVGEIDARRSPHFAELAASSNWFRNATAVTSSTWHALPAILTGRYPHESGPIAADHPDNLFTLLGGTYDLRVEESITRLCPTNLCEEEAGSGDDVDSLRALGTDARRVWRSRVSPEDVDDDPVAGLVEQPAPEEPTGDGFEDFGLNQPARFTDLLDGLGEAEGQTLHYLHVLLPHVPWRYLPSGRQYPYQDGEVGKVDDVWSQEPWPVELGRQRHLLQLRYVDALLGQLVDRLRETGLWDDALVVVTADHGVAFQPGQPARGLEVERFAEAVHPELMWVPLFVKTPHQRSGRTSDANVELVDVLPTIADVLGINLPWKVDGTSALGPGRRQGTKTFFQSQVTPFGVTPGERATVDARKSWPLVLDRTSPRQDEGDELAPWRVGPSPALVGGRLNDQRVGRGVDVLARVNGRDQYDDVDLSSAQVPALLSGSLEGEVGEDDLVVVTLNGAIASVTPTFAWEGEDHAFASMLPEPLLRNGVNDVEVHLLGEDGVTRPTRPPS